VLPTTYTLNARILALLATISEKLGEVKAAHLDRPPASLAKAYLVSAVHATLAIEGNPMAPRPMAELIDSKAHPPEPSALEVTNTHRVHELLPGLDPFLGRDLRHAHGELMHGLALDAGKFRSGPVEVVYGDHYAARTAPAQNLASHMEELLAFAESDDAPVLITSCVLHYAIAHLRPFSAGNGRMARLWQKRLLMRYWPVFSYLPVEAFILRTAPAYHAALGYADQQGDCGRFISYLMERIDEALDELLTVQRPMLDASDRVSHFLAGVGTAWFGRKDYRRMFPELSTITASRDLRDAVGEGRLERSGDGRTAMYRAR
jgi:Fic family protein